MKRRLLIVLALAAFALAACRPAGEPGPTTEGGETSNAPAASSAPDSSDDPYDY
jgi:hypothetical protein